LAAVLAVYLLAPIVVFGVRFAGPGPHGFSEPGLWGAFVTSIATASISTLLIAIVGIPLAQRLAVSDGRVARSIGLLVQLPLALPPVMSGIVLIYVVGPYTAIGELFGGLLTDSLAGVVVAQTFVSAPFLVIGARSAFRAVDPALDEVAATLGHRPLARFFRVQLPAASDGVRAALVLTWLRALGEYGATALLAYHPYTLPVFTNVQFQGSGLPTTEAPTALALAIAIVAVVLGAVRLRPRRRAAVLPEPREPRLQEPASVDLNLNLLRGSFELTVAHTAMGHRLAVLGPSGAGKTLTLRSIAGLLGQGSDARISIGGQDVSHLNTEDRSVGYVPQGGVLLARRTVWEQVTFGVGTDPAVAAWWLRTLRIDGLADRLPDELSGGQRQRVALAQALSREPSMVLLDEPFSALDGPVRDELRTEFRRLQRDRGLSTVVVTHDSEEAALLADEVIVIDGGRVLQHGDRAGIYRKPITPTVARLVGFRRVHEGRVSGPGELMAGTATIAATAIPAGGASALAVGTAVLWSARPEAVRLDPDGPIAAVVVDAVDLGGVWLVELDLGPRSGPNLLARSTQDTPPTVGAECRIAIDAGAVAVWEHRTEG
jgi:molybdate transport system permease protein